ncbi:hypothetical protein HOV93_06100 [Planctomycetes bacterium FF15]|uniref:Uncharacterized protein n=1 Tax=Bremerella alba TaxID=980252 RepID=A0A7V8V235_9BACT|nr:hypothetical protein [Bremerella alba]
MRKLQCGWHTMIMACATVSNEPGSHVQVRVGMSPGLRGHLGRKCDGRSGWQNPLVRPEELFLILRSCNLGRVNCGQRLRPRPSLRINPRNLPGHCPEELEDDFGDTRLALIRSFF